MRLALLYISLHRIAELTMLSEDYFILIIECRENTDNTENVPRLGESVDWSVVLYTKKFGAHT